MLPPIMPLRPEEWRQLGVVALDTLITPSLPVSPEAQEKFNAIWFKKEIRTGHGTDTNGNSGIPLHQWRVLWTFQHAQRRPDQCITWPMHLSNHNINGDYSQHSKSYTVALTNAKRDHFPSVPLCRLFRHWWRLLCLSHHMFNLCLLCKLLFQSIVIVSGCPLKITQIIFYS